MNLGGSSTDTEAVVGDPEASGGPVAKSKHPLSGLAWLGVIAVVASAVVSSNAGSLRDRVFGTIIPSEAPPAPARVAGTPAPEFEAAPTALRSQPWWQEIASYNHDSATPLPEFAVDPSAIQWRLEWRCESATLAVTAGAGTGSGGGGGGGGQALVEPTACPGSGVAYSTNRGPNRLIAQGDGEWTIEVAQQIDSPLVEPPIPEMSDPRTVVVARGAFYDIDKTGVGTLTLYRLEDGAHWIRVEDFFVSPNVDLELRLSPLASPRTSAEYMSAPSEFVTMLDITAGSLNYPVPGDVDPTAFASAVVWCEPVSSAYAAVTLEYR